VRDIGTLQKALDDGVAKLGKLDIVSANAGIGTLGQFAWELSETWRTMRRRSTWSC
jgi:(+)-trans-carveol dehydrogenase/(-)-trans-carveol dehydrogenase